MSSSDNLITLTDIIADDRDAIAFVSHAQPEPSLGTARRATSYAPEAETPPKRLDEGDVS